MQKAIVISSRMHISPSTYRKLYTIDRTIRTIMNICAGIWLVTLIAFVIPTPYRQPFAYASIIFLAVVVILALVRTCLSPFVKSEEEEEFEQKVDYILSKSHADERQSLIEDYSPLCDLTVEQREKVKQLLRNLNSQTDKPDHINLAVMAQYLTALEQLGKARLDDKRNLRLWVAQVTGRKVQSPSQFNEAVPSTNKRKIANAREIIERILQ